MYISTVAIKKEKLSLKNSIKSILEIDSVRKKAFSFLD